MRYPAAANLEIIWLVEQSPLPVRHAGETRHSKGDLLPLGRPIQPWRAGGLERSLAPAGSRLEQHSRRRARKRQPVGARPAGALATRAGGALYRSPELFRLIGLGLPPAEGAGPDRQCGLHPDQGRRRVQTQDYRAQPAMADRLHLSDGDRLGLVLPVDRTRVC